MSRYTLMDYFSIYVEEWDSLLEEFLRHLAMTSFSVVLALIIAVPLGIFITRNKAVSNVVIGIANVMQSIPCMALLAMGIPFLGVGETLAIFMVFVYAFLPILKNTYTGISGISPVSMEVARGIGLTRMQPEPVGPVPPEGDGRRAVRSPAGGFCGILRLYHRMSPL